MAAESYFYSSVGWQGLQTLACCLATSKDFKAAAEQAASQLHLRFAEEGAPALWLGTPGSCAWARRCSNLSVSLNGSGALSTAPGLRRFFRECHVSHADVRCADAVPAALCENAIAAGAGVSSYSCGGYMPAQFPSVMEHLAVSVDLSSLPEDDALEVLLARAQGQVALRSIRISVSISEAVGGVYLRASQLARVQLPSLLSLTLELEPSLASIADLDLSWLSQTRGFELHLSLEDEEDEDDEEAPGHRLRILYSLLSCPQARDHLALTVGVLQPFEQHLLADLQLAEFQLRAESQHLECLPRSPMLRLDFTASDAPVQLSWASLTQGPGRVVVVVYDDGNERVQVIEVLGCTSGVAPAFPAGWQLSVLAEEDFELRGMPPLARQVYVLANAAASDWAPGRMY